MMQQLLVRKVSSVIQMEVFVTFVGNTQTDAWNAIMSMTLELYVTFVCLVSL